ncbi:MAG: hypothetical protein WA364_30885 [Candidatus Nitrosopolaris sp.]
MIAELENKGMSLDVIYELSRVLDLQKLAAELTVRTDPWSSITGLSQNGMNNGHNPSESQVVNKDSNQVNNNPETINNGHKSSDRWVEVI